MRIPRFARLIFKTILLMVLTLVIGIAVLMIALWLDHSRETKLPTPTGPFPVGRTTYAWSDAPHFDALAPPGTSRELLVWIWYPAEPRQPSQTLAEYLPTPWRTALERQSSVLISQFLTRDLSKVRVHSVRDAEVSKQQGSYPIALLRTGGAALAADYTILAEDLASHGYVVVGFDAPYRSRITVLPDGRVIPRAPQNDLDLVGGAQADELANKLAEAWIADTGFALDQLERLNTADPRFLGRLDMQRVGVFGHSLGGATALQFCHDDSRCKAGIDVDGVVLGNVSREGVTQPFMFLMGDHKGEATDTPDVPEAIRHVQANIRSIYNRLPPDRRLMITIRGANHYMFSDAAVLRSPLPMRALRSLGIVHLDGRRQIAITAHYISAFFDVYLKDANPSQLQSQVDYPEVEYVR